MNNYRPYERILKHFKERGDIWMVSQGEFFSWWLARAEATLTITVQDGVCQLATSLEQAAIEQVPGQFLDSLTAPCPDTDFSGELWITIDCNIDEKELLTEILKREGILNYRFAAEGDFMLSKADMTPLLEEIKAKLGQRGRLFEEDVVTIKQLIIDKLAARKLPLFRIWYYPRTNGVVNRAVFSPRYDVDRGITVLGRIRRLEEKYGVTSTLYIRAFCPFYTDQTVKELVSKPWCPEIALHGEFTTNARQFGSEANAAAAEKQHLEQLIGRPILGVCMHGGELSNNTNGHTANIIENVGLLYDTTQSMHYYFPFRRLIDGRLTNSYCLVHATGDIHVPANRAFERLFFEETVATMNEIYAQNGVFVVMFHPVYFGFFRYLAHPKNWGPFVKFFRHYFNRTGR
ncbi:MAG TPA: hypothetical protein VGD99_10665 [Anaerolineae bacterium]